MPRSCRCCPPLALACAASVSCVMGHGEWLCCCCICCCCSPEAKKIWLCATSTSTHAAAAAAAFFSLLLPLLRLSLLPCLLGGPAALVAAPHVPTTPMFLFERNIVLRNTNICFTCSFQAKGIALKTHKVLLPCSACLVHKEPTKERGEDKRSAACRPVHSLARQRDRRRAAARPLCGVRAVTRVLAAGRTTKRERPFI